VTPCNFVVDGYSGSKIMLPHSSESSCSVLPTCKSYWRSFYIFTAMYVYTFVYLSVGFSLSVFSSIFRSPQPLCVCVCVCVSHQNKVPHAALLYSRTTQESLSLYDFVSLAWIQWIVSTAVRRLIGPRSWRRERMKATTWRCRTQTVFISLTFRRNNKVLCSSWSTGLFKEDVCYAEVMVKGMKCFMQRLYWGEWSVLCRGYTEGNKVFYAEVILREMKSDNSFRLGVRYSKYYLLNIQ
jgi:hypothetical protein